MPPAPHTILVGRYRLGRELGRGAHSTVYLAEDLGRGGELVALKLTRSEQEGYAFFEPAARKLHWFRHPYWADVYDAGVVPTEEDGPRSYAQKANRAKAPTDTWFQVQRYVAGRSLEHLVGPQPVELVSRFLEHGARVLQGIHDKGLIHYDVTPSNFILEETKQGPVFVLTDGALAHVGPVEGTARGTPLFMAPEVTEEGTHDHRVDLYSLGLIAYRMLTGEDALANEGEDPADVLARRRQAAAPQVSAVRDDVPEALNRAIAALLEPVPTARPAHGRALLKLLAKVREEDLPELTSSEAIARAEHGPLVGQALALTRFETACSRLAWGLPWQDGQTSHTSTGSTFLLTGDPGAGRTRLLHALQHTARLAELPVLWVAGETRDRSSGTPLGQLAAGLYALMGRPERAREWAVSRPAGRRIEDFLRLTLEVADRTPFALVVEDYASLTPVSRDMFAALARELQGRYEYQADRPPRILLAIDLGTASTTELTLPDAENPEAPILPVEPLTPATLRGFMSERYPGVPLSEEETEHLLHHVDHNPVGLISVLTQAFEAHDLQSIDGHWTLRPGALQEVTPKPQLSPALQRALQVAEPTVRDLLLHLALLKADLDTGTARELAGLPTGAPLPRTILLARRFDDQTEYVGLAKQALRSTLLASASEEQVRRARRALSTALAKRPSVENAADRVSLHVALNEHAAALSVFAREQARLSQDERRAIMPEVRRAAEMCLRDIDSAEVKFGLSSGLVSSPASLAIARILAESLTTQDAELGTLLKVVGIVEQVSGPPEALDLLRYHITSSALSPAVRTELRIQQARIALDCRYHEEAQVLVHELKPSVAVLKKQNDRQSRRLYALYLMQTSRLAFKNKRHETAIRQLVVARAYVRRSRDPQLHARVLNNLGIALESRGSHEDALRPLLNSLRLKRLLGDGKGLVTTTFNIARIHRRRGELVAAIEKAHDAADYAQRHNLRPWMVRILRELAQAQDQQQRPDLAYPTLHRAWRALRNEKASPELGQVAQSLAPLAATFGDLKTCSRVLRTTAESARLLRQADERSSAAFAARAAHYLTAAAIAVFTGSRSRFSLSVRRLLRGGSGFEAALPPSVRQHVQRLRILERAYMGDDDEALPASGQADPGEPGEVQLVRILAWHHRVRAGQAGAPLPREEERAPGKPGAALVPGESGRLAAEFVLEACWRNDLRDRAALLSELEAYATSNGFRYLLARVLLTRAAVDDSEAGQHKALQFSRSVELLDASPKGHLRCSAVLPFEAHATVSALHETITFGGYSPESTEELHAIAHKLILLKGVGSAPDKRLAVALRRVLEASAQVRAGASLQELLASVSKHAIDITEAQRAYVLVFEEGSTDKVGESTWDDTEGRGVESDQLVTTVIDRVIATRTPYLFHGVLENQLLPNSKSWRDLSLNSVLCVPILRGTEMLGVLYADTRSRAMAFDNVDREVLQLFAEQAGAAIETHRLVQDVQLKLNDLKAMQERLMKGERLRVVGELSSGVAHEFNNLLQSILARIQNMHMNDLCEQSVEDLRLIQKASEDATEIVRRLQGFSRQQRQVNFEVLKASDFCQDALDLLRPLWRSSAGPDGQGVQVNLRAEDNLWVRGDGTELREVVTNLVKNALESLDGNGRILVTAGRRHGKVRIYVRDNGQGIPAAILDRVCDPFFTTKGERGTGLGLCLSQQIVHKHAGSLTIHSEPGRGTSVRVELPAVGTGSTRPSVRQPSDGRSAPPKRPEKTMRVLVVDDDDEVRTPLVSYLSRSGIHVHGVNCGRDALAAVEGREFDVVLTDVAMPGMSGLELCRGLRDTRPELPVVLMSGNAVEMGLEGNDTCGAAAVLTKPFSMSELVTLLNEVVGTS